MAAARSVTGGPVGRAPELAVLEAFLGGVTGSRALVLIGVPGIGKTTLSHVYAKLGVRSRAQLARRLSGAA